MKKLYICPQIKWTVVSDEIEMIAASPVGATVKDESASGSYEVLSREDNNSFDLWNDEE